MTMYTLKLKWKSYIGNVEDTFDRSSLTSSITGNQSEKPNQAKCRIGQVATHHLLNIFMFQLSTPYISIMMKTMKRLRIQAQIFSVSPTDLTWDTDIKGLIATPTASISTWIMLFANINLSESLEWCYKIILKFYKLPF